MKKLKQLKQWFTLSEAASAKASLWSEPVTATDLVALVVQGRFDLSVVFANPQPAFRFEPFDALERLESWEIPPLDEKRIVRLDRYPGDAFLTCDGLAIRCEDHYPSPVVHRLKSDFPYALCMIGGEVEAVRGLYWDATARDPDQYGDCGCFVSDGEAIYQLRKMTADGAVVTDRDGALETLPQASRLVVTKQALDSLEKLVVDADASQADKPLGTLERQNMERLIGVMAMAAYKFDPEAKSDVPGKIAKLAEQYGFNITPPTVRKYLDRGCMDLEPKQSSRNAKSNSSSPKRIR
jgi:hypothetical protein